jgi:hypothetical protein
MSITREEIRQLCIAHDRFMAEHASEPIRRPTVSETDDANSAPAPAPVADADWSGWEAWLAGHLANVRRELLDDFARAMGELISELRREWRHEIDRRISTLQCENAELRGMLGATLQLLGQRPEDRSKSGQIIDLPDWRRPRDVA